MSAKKTGNIFVRTLSSIVNVIGNLGTAVVVMMMLLTVADVTGRRVFNFPITGTFELSGLMMIIIIFFSIVHCQLRKGHVTIDLVVERFSKRAQNILNSVLYLLFLGTFGVVTWQVWVNAFTAYADKLTSGSFALPTYPFVFLAALGCSLLCLVVIVHLVEFVQRATANEY